MINWKITAAEFDTIASIARRAESELSLEFRPILMDLNAVHANGNPLDLDGLTTASPLDFSHDILGIRHHINRDTGKLEDFFTPRYTLKAVPNASPLVSSVPVCLECGDRCITILEDADSGGRCEGCRNSETDGSK